MAVMLFLTGVSLFAADSFARRHYLLAALATGLGIAVGVGA